MSDVKGSACEGIPDKEGIFGFRNSGAGIEERTYVAEQGARDKEKVRTDNHEFCFIGHCIYRTVLNVFFSIEKKSKGFRRKCPMSRDRFIPNFVVEMKKHERKIQVAHQIHGHTLVSFFHTKMIEARNIV